MDLASAWEKYLEMKFPESHNLDQDLFVQFHTAKKVEFDKLESFIIVLKDWHEEKISEVETEYKKSENQRS